MKKINVNQQYNPRFVSTELTPDEDTYIYQVTKVVNAVAPTVGEVMTKTRTQAFCDSEEWSVTVS